MAAANSLPVLGACMPVSALPAYREWLIADQRDLELQDFCEASVLDSDWRARATEAKALLEGYKGRLGIHGPFWGFTIASQDPEIRTVVRRRLDQGLDACAELGATQMVVHSPFTTWMHNNLDIDHKARRKVLELSHDTLLPAVRRAEALGVTLVIENIEDKDPMERLHLAKSFGSSAVKLSVDTGHAYYAHRSTGAPPVDYFIRAAGELLDHVHIQDADGYADRHWAPGLGTINWPSGFAALAEIEAKPRLNIEIKDKGAIREGAAFLQGRALAV